MHIYYNYELQHTNVKRFVNFYDSKFQLILKFLNNLLEEWSIDEVQAVWSCNILGVTGGGLKTSWIITNLRNHVLGYTQICVFVEPTNNSFCLIWYWLTAVTQYASDNVQY